MISPVIMNRLGQYRIDSPDAEYHALREVTQELVLFALSRRNGTPGSLWTKPFLGGS